MANWLSTTNQSLKSASSLRQDQWLNNNREPEIPPSSQAAKVEMAKISQSLQDLWLNVKPNIAAVPKIDASVAIETTAAATSAAAAAASIVADVTKPAVAAPVPTKPADKEEKWLSNKSSLSSPDSSESAAAAARRQALLQDSWLNVRPKRAVEDLPLEAWLGSTDSRQKAIPVVEAVQAKSAGDVKARKNKI